MFIFNNKEQFTHIKIITYFIYKHNIDNNE